MYWFLLCPVDLSAYVGLLSNCGGGQLDTRTHGSLMAFSKRRLAASASAVRGLRGSGEESGWGGLPEATPWGRHP